MVGGREVCRVAATGGDNGAGRWELPFEGHGRGGASARGNWGGCVTPPPRRDRERGREGGGDGAAVSGTGGRHRGGTGIGECGGGEGPGTGGDRGLGVIWGHRN